ncbi:hypothetical protein DFH06DRAFT_580954 [Mycena polygramma]|nr:hypothetical protein DFH06DRAFT_580954 [Mycena polygramma]
MGVRQRVLQGGRLRASSPRFRARLPLSYTDPGRMIKWQHPTIPTPEVDWFRRWDIPLATYKGIGQGPRFVPIDQGGDDPIPDYLAVLPPHTHLSTLPPPAGPGTGSLPTFGGAPASNLSRALVIRGLRAPRPDEYLERIHEGALEHARYERGRDVTPARFSTHTLTLSFLSSSAAHAFARKHLCEPAALFEFARAPNPSWEWLPWAPVSTAVQSALKHHAARRALSIQWFNPAHRWRRAPSEFGPHQPQWKFSPSRVIVHFWSIESAIKAHSVLSGDSRLRISFFPDLCEMGPAARRVLVRASMRAYRYWPAMAKSWSGKYYKLDFQKPVRAESKPDALLPIPPAHPETDLTASLAKQEEVKDQAASTTRKDKALPELKTPLEVKRRALERESEPNKSREMKPKAAERALEQPKKKKVEAGVEKMKEEKAESTARKTAMTSKGKSKGEHTLVREARERGEVPDGSSAHGGRLEPPYMYVPSLRLALLARRSLAGTDVPGAGQAAGMRRVRRFAQEEVTPADKGKAKERRKPVAGKAPSPTVAADLGKGNASIPKDEPKLSATPAASTAKQNELQPPVKKGKGRVKWPLPKVHVDEEQLIEWTPPGGASQERWEVYGKQPRGTVTTIDIRVLKLGKPDLRTYWRRWGKRMREHVKKMAERNDDSKG